MGVSYNVLVFLDRIVCYHTFTCIARMAQLAVWSLVCFSHGPFVLRIWTLRRGSTRSVVALDHGTAQQIA